MPEIPVAEVMEIAPTAEASNAVIGASIEVSDTVTEVQSEVVPANIPA